MNKHLENVEKPNGFPESDYWEARVNSMVRSVQPGDYNVTGRNDLTLTTLLGSCVSACICDPVAGIGGLNHFLLPDMTHASNGTPSDATRYGVQAMEMLINEILKRGGHRARLEAKLFGGANVITMATNNPVGLRNQKFSLAFLRNESIPVTASDLGGSAARRVFFMPFTNKVLVRVTASSEAKEVQAAESQITARKPQPRNDGNVELF